MALTHLSLFSGIGGIDLAAEWAGFETVGQVEWAEYPRKVLEKHWPDVPRWKDIKEFTGDEFYKTTGMRTVDLISGGFPCQPFSVAGKRKGKDDDRFLWPEMLRVIAEHGPVWVFAENVPNILNLGIEICLSNLESIGYQGGVFVVPAIGVGAEFMGDRVFIVATSDCQRWNSLDKELQGKSTKEHLQVPYKRIAGSGYISVDMDGFFTNTSCGTERNDDGLSEGVDRLTCLGNAVMPQQAYPFMKFIADIERSLS